MKLWVFKLVVFLLLGAIVNVAVAWGCATILKPRNVSHVTVSRAECITHIAKYFDLQHKDSSYHGYIIKAVSFELQYASRTVNDPWNYARVARIESGWPMRSLVGECMSDYKDELDRSWFVTALKNPWLADNEQKLNFIPNRPIWPGFAINTVFYAAILWLLTLGPFTARRMNRRKRGLCIKCGYDLRGDILQGCPECGWGREEDK